MKTFKPLALIWMCVTLVVCTSGCRLCCAPYDSWGPVVGATGGSDLTHQRCGSGVNQRQVETPIMPEQIPTPAPRPLNAPDPTNRSPAPIKNTPAENSVPAVPLGGATAGTQQLPMVDENGVFRGMVTLDAQGRVLATSPATSAVGPYPPTAQYVAPPTQNRMNNGMSENQVKQVAVQGYPVMNKYPINQVSYQDVSGTVPENNPRTAGGWTVRTRARTY